MKRRKKRRLRKRGKERKGVREESGEKIAREAGHDKDGKANSEGRRTERREIESKEG